MIGDAPNVGAASYAAWNGHRPKPATEDAALQF